MNCPRCDKPCQEENVRQKRDGSMLIRAIHDEDGSVHTFHEWSSVSAFISRKYPSDAGKRRHRNE